MVHATPYYHQPIRPSFSLPSILAIVCAFGSFFAAAGWGLLLAGLAIVLGAVGVVLSLSPRVRGGVTSVLSIGVAAIAIITAFVKIVA